MNDPRIILVSLLTGTVVCRSTFSEWAIDNGECLALDEVVRIGSRLVQCGEYRIDDHLLINADFSPVATDPIPAAA